ncbi:hypothetical protein NLI96_g4583 [Meripilus lineatus]|uniref:Protein kinase domain-containing protein n=1 Tax=Meripilus lineatus TaxID=2056292 RepID=A0AAD5YFJ7_9APHY|nr:hypothetical protein NLI96_g4583 [Physisporinus lineatus]
MASPPPGTDVPAVQPIPGSTSNPLARNSGHTGNPPPNPPPIGSLGATPRRLNSNKSFGTKDLKTNRKLAAEGMEKRSVYIKYELWMTRFASRPTSTSESSTLPIVQYLIQASDFNKEATSYSKLLDGMQPILESGGLAGRITADHPSNTSSTGIVGTNMPNVKVDLSIFESSGRNSEGLVTKCDLTAQEKKDSNNPFDSYLARADWDQIVVPIEVKSINYPCAFYLPEAQSTYPEAGTIKGEESRGQITQYVALIFEHQHRNFVFSIYIHVGRVFLIRWDRVGAVIAEPFDLFTEPHKLQNFLYRLAKMSPAERGYDTSIRVASEDEQKEFKALRDVNSVHNTYIQDALKMDDKKEAAIFRVDLQAMDPKKPMVKLVFARPRVLGEGAVGRATRGYVAYDLDEKRLVFLKDYWQPQVDSYHPELETYKKLQANHVPYIATPVGGGNVPTDPNDPKSPSQETVAQKYLLKTLGRSYSARVHYRFAVKEIGRPLEDYTDAGEMLQAVAFALTAHRVAWEVAGVLHRDISPANILITEDGDGLLNDWDMCRYKTDPTNLQSPAFRSGTWPFMSALLLCCPEKPHQVSDDLESFVHVINWLTLRYQVNSTPKAIGHAMEVYEEYSRTDGGTDVGGGLKLANLNKGDPCFDTRYVRPVALAGVVLEMMKMCQEHYSSPDVLNQLTRSGVQIPVAPLILSAASQRRKTVRLPVWRGSRPHPVQAPVPPAPVDSKPLMEDHERITGILWGTFESLTDPQLWEGEKLEDQFLKRPTEGTCGTPPGGTAGSQANRTSQKRSQNMQKAIQPVSNPRSTRSAASIEDPEVQGKSKRTKRGNAGMPPRVAEGDEGGGDTGEDKDPFQA